LVRIVVVVVVVVSFIVVTTTFTTTPRMLCSSRQTPFVVEKTTLSTGLLRGRGTVRRLAGGAKRKGTPALSFRWGISVEDARTLNARRWCFHFYDDDDHHHHTLGVDDDGNNAATTRSSSAKSVRFVKRDVVAGASSFNASNKAAAVAITQTNDDDGKEEETTRQKQKLIDVHALKHFCALGVFFTGLLYVAYALLPHIGYTATRPPHTENLMVKTFQSLSTLQAAEWLRFMDLFGTGVFAHGGVIAAGKRGLDLLGCVVVGCVTAMGGGTLRGALIGIEGAHPVFWIAEPEYLIVALVASLCTFFFWPKLLSKEVRESKAMETAVNWLDALSLGGFCIIGANAALVRNLGPLLAVALSTVTCTGGGVIRDVFLRQPVRVLHSNAELYGTTAIAGAVVYALFVCQFPGVSHDVRCVLSASTVVFLRWRAWKQGLKLPMYADVNPEGDYISIAQRDV